MYAHYTTKDGSRRNFDNMISYFAMYDFFAWKLQ